MPPLRVAAGSGPQPALAPPPVSAGAQPSWGEDGAGGAVSFHPLHPVAAPPESIRARMVNGPAVKRSPSRIRWSGDTRWPLSARKVPLVLRSVRR
ncbi:hypothetical protein [Sphingomonas hankookensis]|uniref:hypothetical protein n=1 Tax=Sphingomonas hankookensis TaxID=563996 RepID=UPI00234F5007|nr:hypothetical protein [Sphingomonas hankookensis]WCP72863.1 hypothetical protein PPZ50_04745 [Sphingomonas hankookensis]